MGVRFTCAKDPIRELGVWLPTYRESDIAGFADWPPIAQQRQPGATYVPWRVRRA
jgi:hypothetical protein